MKLLSTSTLFALSAVALAAPSSAQDYGRGWRTKALPYTVPSVVTGPGGAQLQSYDIVGSVHFLAGAPSSPAGVLWTKDQSTGFASLPFHQIGDIVTLSRDLYLVSGWNLDSSTGHYCLVRLIAGSPPTVSIEQIVDLGQLDAVSLGLNRETRMLYLLDYRTNDVSRASWPLGGALPSGPDFQFCFDEDLVPALERPGYIELEGADMGEAGVPVIPGQSTQLPADAHEGVILHLPQQFPIRMDEHLGVWSANLGEYMVRHPGSTHIRSTDKEWGSADGITLTKSGDGDGTYSIRNLATSQVIATGNLPHDGATVTLGPFSEFNETPGTWYAVETPTDTVIGSHYFSSVRHGQPTSVPGWEVTKGSFVIDENGPMLGSPFFGVAAGLPERSLGENTPIAGVLWIGFRDAAGNDPVTMSGQTALLTPTISLPFSVGGNGNVPADVGHNIPLPTDPVFDGQVLLFQYAFVLPGNTFAFSDVFGIGLMSPPSTAAMTDGGGSGPGANADAGLRAKLIKSLRRARVRPATTDRDAGQLATQSAQ